MAQIHDHTRGIDRRTGEVSSSSMSSIFDLARPELAEVVSPSYRATQIYKGIYQQWRSDFRAMTDLPKSAREELAAQWSPALPSVRQRFDSTDGTRRYLIDLGDGELAETVFIPEEHRNTICI